MTGKPAADKAVINAHAPGIGTTSKPASLTNFTKGIPGSLSNGVPASETKAIESPERNLSNNIGEALSSLC